MWVVDLLGCAGASDIMEVLTKQPVQFSEESAQQYVWFQIHVFLSESIPNSCELIHLTSDDWDT